MAVLFTGYGSRSTRALRERRQCPGFVPAGPMLLAQLPIPAPDVGRVQSLREGQVLAAPAIAAGELTHIGLLVPPLSVLPKSSQLQGESKPCIHTIAVWNPYRDRSGVTPRVKSRHTSSARGLRGAPPEQSAATSIRPTGRASREGNEGRPKPTQLSSAAIRPVLTLSIAATRSPREQGPAQRRSEEVPRPRNNDVVGSRHRSRFTVPPEHGHQPETSEPARSRRRCDD